MRGAGTGRGRGAPGARVAPTPEGTLGRPDPAPEKVTRLPLPPHSLTGMGEPDLNEPQPPPG